MSKLLLALAILVSVTGCVDQSVDTIINPNQTNEVTTMGTTSTFIKSRSSATPKVGEWNINYSKALTQAKKEYKFIVICWSNGDKCGSCITAEACMMKKAFKDFMKTSDAYFVFQYSGDKDKGQTVHDLIYKPGKIRRYPGFRVMLFDQKDSSKVLVDTFIEGDTLRGGKTGDTGAKNMVEKLQKIFAKKPATETTESEPTAPAQEKKCVVRLNENLTTAKINKVLDALYRNDGYYPCQAKSENTKCHCEDFVKNKKFGEPCICKIFVKKPVPTVKSTKKVAKKA